MTGKWGDRPTFIDVDGTLTKSPLTPWGEVIPERIEEVQRLIANGVSVVIWSGGGTTYARAFADANGLGAAICIGKPEVVVDDNPEIRPNFKSKIQSPEAFFGDG